MKIPVPLRYRLINPLLMCVGLKIIPVNIRVWSINEKGQRTGDLRTLGYRLAWWRHWFRMPDQFTELDRIVNANMRKNGDHLGRRSSQGASADNRERPGQPPVRGRRRH